MDPWEKRPLRPRHILLWVMMILVLVFLITPTIMVIPMSFTTTDYLVFPPSGFTWQWHYRFLTDSSWVDATVYSLKLAALATMASLIIGTMASLALVKGTLPFRNLTRLLVLSPLMTPIIAIAFAVYGVYVRLHLLASLTGLVIAHAIICTPYVVLVVSANLYRLDTSLELAARNLGCNTFGVLYHVTFPLIRPALLSACIFCFIESLDEMVLAMFLIGSTEMTLPLRIFSDIQFRISPVVAAASTIFVAVAVGTLVFQVLITERDNPARVR